MSDREAVDLPGSNLLEGICGGCRLIAVGLSLRMGLGSQFFYRGTDSKVEFGADYFLPIVWDDP